ncbi:putative PurR-regulated permease PerM [Luteimonas cucumeris]|uniref:Putative PurR-regulated permease PerM n=1 Tax=Luteimonas cucumeris TaxID=985012 RepID=A0A562L2G3_9GAMM|nr:AI-2E family transporter [Luteimonas cucumeris]TWI01822.1 putative PurR-regulated permease PerM [Luteimonas cucumeris]
MTLPPDAPDTPEPEPPAPSPRPRGSTALVVLAVLAVGYTLWAAQDLILPILLAMFFALVGNPILRGLRRIYIPRFLGAALLLVLGLAGAVMLGRQLIGPAGEWMQQMPRELRVLAPKLREMTQPMQQANKAAESFARAAGDSQNRKVQVVAIQDPDPWKSLTATPKLLASVLAVVLLTFFFMTYGENLQRNAIALLPGRQQKKLTVDILQSIEREISRYVLTISIINTLLGLAVAGALHAMGLELPEALLWGTVAALLNFAPYVGPLIGVILMLLMGFVSFEGLWPNHTWSPLMPATVYLTLHVLEGQLITPIVLGRRMALSPLLLILALLLFGWLWGIIGLLLAVPLLVCMKIVLARIEGLEGWARLLE